MSWGGVVKYWVLGLFYVSAIAITIWACAGFELEVEKAKITIEGDCHGDESAEGCRESAEEGS